MPKKSKVVVLPAAIRFEGRARIGTLTFTFDRLEMLQELMDTDGYMNRILIHDDKFFIDELERLGLAVKHTRGSWYKGSKLDAWMKEYGDALAIALRTSQDGDALLIRTKT